MNSDNGTTDERNKRTIEETQKEKKTAATATTSNECQTIIANTPLNKLLSP